MKVLCEPSSGKIRDRVAYISPYGQCFRALVIPANPHSPAQEFMRQLFGNLARSWGGRLTDPQRDLWNEEATTVWTHPKLGKAASMSGEQLYEAINSVRGRVGLQPALEPPPRYAFPLSVVRNLVAVNSGEGVRLFLRLAGEPTEDIMVFGQAPCSAGRSKRRNVAYLGLLPPAVDGLSEITALYKARYGEPRPGTKLFIVTCQQKNGWKGIEQETSDIIPHPPKAAEPAAEGTAQGLPRPTETSVPAEMASADNAPHGLTGPTRIGAPGVIHPAETVLPDLPYPAQAAPNGIPAPATPGNRQKPLMHKGCTRGAEETDTPVVSSSPEGAEPRASRRKAAGAASGGDGGRDGGRDSPR
jgi:hypothetical protein